MAQAITVLFVEDDDLVRDTLADALPGREYRTLVASSGYEAMRILAQNHVDVLFTDVVMPGLNGIDLVIQAQLLRPDLKVILMTGYMSRGEEARAVGTVLFKPLRPMQIETAVRDVLTGTPASLH